jgi:hypothetical protein
MFISYSPVCVVKRGAWQANSTRANEKNSGLDERNSLKNFPGEEIRHTPHRPASANTPSFAQQRKDKKTLKINIKTTYSPTSTQLKDDPKKGALTIKPIILKSSTLGLSAFIGCQTRIEGGAKCVYRMLISPGSCRRSAPRS